ncbi:hypothetical protein FKW77_001922 [Venturia effusa]|uniref:Uncharacterized protein n=1 Tax=Venturia effusa TaxID=50376 RepID=A0A517LPP5_9PEZI|nr:hypothetical protein FKW77_001922 [Venturia effusa]
MWRTTEFSNNSMNPEASNVDRILPELSEQLFSSVPHSSSIPGNDHGTSGGADTLNPQLLSCEQCELADKDISYCNVCKSLFCDECWSQQFVHRKAKLGPGRIPHERTGPKVAEKVRNALAPPVNDRVLAQMCRDDELTSWFGIERSSENGPPTFQDYGRLSDLMSATDPVRRRHRNSSGGNGSQRTRDTRTPSLVSFVGQTGAGKSTLIKLLIDLGPDDNVLLPSSQTDILFPTPVVGATGGHLPTSEDVHLYLDPRTANSMSPVLFADCEGLEGGEREPTGAKLRKKRKHEEGRFAGAIKAISEQEITWADSPRTRTREFAVTNLYLRLLYTFSDVIVFVLKNPRFVCPASVFSSTDKDLESLSTSLKSL